MHQDKPRPAASRRADHDDRNGGPTAAPPDPVRLGDWRQTALRISDEVSKAVIGQAQVVRLITIALFSRGHVLLEGDVGVGKTTVLRAFARAIGGDFERVEGTIDMMPSDLVYHTHVDGEGRPRIDPGPLLRHGERLTTFFFNEINRARPQVQSLLLRAMAERSVTAFNREYRFPHMTVFADRNKVEKEETFELASAARDRFMFELSMDKPADREVRRALAFDPAFHDTDHLLSQVSPDLCGWDALNEVAEAIQRQVRSSPTIEKYLLDIWEATDDPKRVGVAIDGVDIDRLVLAGASPRGMSALMRAARTAAWLSGRDHVTPDDLREILPSALTHRVFFRPIYEIRRAEIAPELIRQIVDRIAAP